MNHTEYLLDCLAEECAEVIQRVTKANRFGLSEVEPGQGLTNAQRILIEFNDIKAVAELLEDRRELYLTWDRPLIEAKKEKLRKFMAYSEQCGTLESPPPSAPREPK